MAGTVAGNVPGSGHVPLALLDCDDTWTCVGDSGLHDVGERVDDIVTVTFTSCVSVVGKDSSLLLM